MRLCTHLRFLWTTGGKGAITLYCSGFLILYIASLVQAHLHRGTTAVQSFPSFSYVQLSHSLSFPLKNKKQKQNKKNTHLKKKKKKKKKMIATILEPGNQVIDWSSRKLDLYSRQGFSFLLRESPNLLHLLSTFPRCLTAGDSCYLRRSLQPCYREGGGGKNRKAMAQQKCKTHQST